MKKMIIIFVFLAVLFCGSPSFGIDIYGNYLNWLDAVSHS